MPNQYGVPTMLEINCLSQLRGDQIAAINEFLAENNQKPISTNYLKELQNSEVGQELLNLQGVLPRGAFCEPLGVCGNSYFGVDVNGDTLEQKIEDWKSDLTIEEDNDLGFQDNLEAFKVEAQKQLSAYAVVLNTTNLRDCYSTDILLLNSEFEPLSVQIWKI